MSHSARPTTGHAFYALSDHILTVPGTVAFTNHILTVPGAVAFTNLTLTVSGAVP